MPQGIFAQASNEVQQFSQHHVKALAQDRLHTRLIAQGVPLEHKLKAKPPRRMQSAVELTAAC